MNSNNVFCNYSNAAIAGALRELIPQWSPRMANVSLVKRSFWNDYAPLEVMPEESGTEFHKLLFHGDVGPQFTGHSTWTPIKPTTFGSTVEPPNNACGFKFDTVNWGLEGINYSVLQKYLKTEQFCIEDWRYARFGTEVVDNIVESLGLVTINQTEQFTRNTMLTLSEKVVVTGSGLQNNGDPLLWPNIKNGSNIVDISRLNPAIMREIYARLSRRLGVNNGLVMGGAQAFLAASDPATLSDAFYDNSNLRQDIRFSSYSDDLLNKYQLRNTFQEMFLLMGDINMPRLNVDASGNLYEVYAYERDVPTQYGTRSAANVAWDNAPYGIVLFFGLDPFRLITFGTRESIGKYARFEAKGQMFSWDFHVNKLTCDGQEDPFGRTGYFFTNARLGYEPGNYAYAVALVVKRRPQANLYDNFGDPVCPSTVVCNNVLATQDCPCPRIIDVWPGLTTRYLNFQFDRDPGIAVAGSAQIQLSTGTYATATLTAESSDGLRGTFDFGSTAEVFPTPGLYIGILCNATTICSSSVVSVNNCIPSASAAADTIGITTFDSLAVTSSDTVTLYFCDGSSVTAAVDSVDTGLNSMIVSLSGIKETVCELGAPCTVCVVPTEDNGCPACTPTYDVCGGGTAVLPSN